MLKANHRAWVEVNLGAIAHNVRQVLGLLSPDTQLLAVVKADAYGHGAVAVSRAAVAAGARWLGVATVGEGIELRQGGLTVPILVMGALRQREEMAAAIAHGLHPTVCDPEQALLLNEEAAARGACLPVHLKIDTGMGRLGLAWPTAIATVREIAELPHLAIEGVYTHFANADEPDPTPTWTQQQRFAEICQTLATVGIQPQWQHQSNTAATLDHRFCRGNLVRVGLGLYGYAPAPHLQGILDLQPALQVWARITQLKEVPAGTGLSYGWRFVTDRPTRVATVAIGYADGVPRALSNRIAATWRGQTLPQIGTITMDQSLWDVTTAPAIAVGDAISVLGPHHDAAHWAALTGTIPWEILCGFKHRLPRLPVSLVSPAGLAAATHPV
ncbi:MAG: alanine racemase [Pseudanabaenaceae cyanobacterium]